MEKRANWKKSFLSGVLIITLLVPYVTLSSSKKYLHVDEDVEKNDSQDGSEEHPFRTIKQAIDAASSGTQIFVAKGEYEENIIVKEGIEIFGKDKDKTIIKADHRDRPVVTLYDDTKIDNFTIRDGEEGVKVENNAGVSIVNCIIKDNREDGIDIDEGENKDSQEVIITKNKISHNGRAGIYSERRKLVLTDNEISGNGSDGANIERGTNAWIYGNTFSYNSGSGLKLTLDASNIWTKNNYVKANKREGLEVATFGGGGKINIEKTKITENGRYGVARLVRAANGASALANGLSFQGLPNDIRGNASGTISSLLFIH